MRGLVFCVVNWITMMKLKNRLQDEQCLKYVGYVTLPSFLFMSENLFTFLD